MQTICPWDPARALRFDPSPDLDAMLRGFGFRPSWNHRDAGPDIRLDAGEEGGTYWIEAEIPGADKDDIDILIEGVRVSIQAKVKLGSRNDRCELMAERRFGKAIRTLLLPVEADASQAQAAYSNGILTITVPKKRKGSVQHVPIG